MFLVLGVHQHGWMSLGWSVGRPLPKFQCCPIQVDYFFTNKNAAENKKKKTIERGFPTLLSCDRILCSFVPVLLRIHIYLYV